jgi:hypothetical protein
VEEVNRRPPEAAEAETNKRDGALQTKLDHSLDRKWSKVHDLLTKPRRSSPGLFYVSGGAVVASRGLWRVTMLFKA